MTTVAISDDFLKAYSELPKAQQKKAREFTEKFRADPKHPSINYERIHDMRDDKVRTVRIDQTYRAIVIHPPEGDVFLLVWVDHHDEAMAWARNKRFDVHPTTGSLQVYEVRERAEAAPAKAEPADESKVPKGRLLAGTSHDDLMILGVPEPLLPAVRALRTEVDLEELLPYLPREAADALFLLAAGETPDGVLAELERTRAEKVKVDVKDFEKALERPDSKAKFKVVENEQELLDMLSKPLELWRIFLHPSQRKLVEWDVGGPIRVLGGAGTGKTVVAMHRARHLAKQHAGNPDAKILLTTYTRNLACDIDRALDSLCGDERRAIEVTNLHKWANQFLRSKGVRFILVQDGQERELWKEAVQESELDLPQAFFEEEWKFVVQAQDILDRETYFKAKRTGRGTALSRKQKAEVWKVMEAYRSALERRGLLEQDDVIREARLYLEQNPGSLPYIAVVADEVQDFRVADLRLLRAMVAEGRNDLFVVGDAHQRIYRHKASLGACGINIRGRSRRLRINYRTTERIRNFAVALLEGVAVDDLDEGLDSVKGYHSLRAGVDPVVKSFPNQDAEGRFIIEQVKAWLEKRPSREICIAARTNELVRDVYGPTLEKAGIGHVVVKSEAEEDLGEGIRLSTMHRMKGLEFPCVIMAAFNEGVVPLRLSDQTLGDEASTEDHEQSERCLAHVAATRARDELVVTSFGNASRWLRS
jgi:mRNA-degrading endonuclease RelE of RelBE toxin-antitoxin system